MCHQQSRVVSALLSLGFVMMIVACSAVPIDEIDDTDEDIKRSLLLARLLDASDKLRLRSELLDKEREQEQAELPFISQKRYRSGVQSRSGTSSFLEQANDSGLLVVE